MADQGVIEMADQAYQVINQSKRQSAPKSLPDPVDFAKEHEYGTRVQLPDGSVYALRKPTWQVVPPAKSESGNGTTSAPATPTAPTPAHK